MSRSKRAIDSPLEGIALVLRALRLEAYMPLVVARDRGGGAVMAYPGAFMCAGKLTGGVNVNVGRALGRALDAAVPAADRRA